MTECDTIELSVQKDKEAADNSIEKAQKVLDNIDMDDL